jgi:hypothetical protein
MILAYIVKLIMLWAFSWQTLSLINEFDGKSGCTSGGDRRLMVEGISMQVGR